MIAADALLTHTDPAFRRAVGTAVEVSGAYSVPPVRFWPLASTAARLVEARRADGQWVLVTCATAAEPAHAAHLRERSRTAAQRFSLSLWCDGLDAVWIGDDLPERDAFRAAGLDIGTAEPVGLVWVNQNE